MAVDLGEDFKLSKVATLGKADDQNRFVTKYALEYSSDGSKWQEYKDATGKRVSYHYYYYFFFFHLLIIIFLLMCSRVIQDIIAVV